MPLTVSHSPAFQAKLARLANLLEQAGRLARELSKPSMTFTPVAGRPRPANIPKDQEWFWTDEWQKGEREVDEALARGEYQEFDNVEDAIAFLHKGV